MTTGLPDFPVQTYDHPLPLHFEAPPVNPTAFGLYTSTAWTEIGADQPSRHLHGVEVRGNSYPNGQSAGVWNAPWCGDPAPGQLKQGHRPDILDAFEPMVLWAADECDLTAPSRAEVIANAAQILRLEEQVMAEREFAERLKLDAADLGTPQTAASFKQAVGYLEAAAALTNTLTFFHAGAQWASQEFGLVLKSGTRWTSPLGHVWIFGGGYVEGLENMIVATSQPYGWRDEPQVRTTMATGDNLFVAIAERTVVIGYEAAIAAVTITTPEPAP
ncbi:MULTISPECIES: hypothetical protein [Mycolicibacter]|uniref:hypothetical protein n=1 Tax=Mycolicibacter TaxID=1073531 RepID=UPI00122C622F|nr:MULTISPECIES: hypothetical protein [Mycolicibacter]KAA1431095.1 hypothetical protein F0402_10610 [Mycolicibacter arupensis]ULP48678.1 hypothetical protein MJO54_06125 [Mycolicibacter virginiensis]